MDVGDIQVPQAKAAKSFGWIRRVYLKIALHANRQTALAGQIDIGRGKCGGAVVKADTIAEQSGCERRNGFCAVDALGIFLLGHHR